MKELKLFKVSFKEKLNLCWKILRTNSYSKGYTIEELLEDEF